MDGDNNKFANIGLVSTSVGEAKSVELELFDEWECTKSSKQTFWRPAKLLHVLFLSLNPNIPGILIQRDCLLMAQVPTNKRQ